MGKPNGFLEYNRIDNTSIAPLERIKNFNEFHIPISDDKRKEQASRCMNCGVPFCQAGAVYNGMMSGCPLHNLIPEWNDAIYHDNWEEAAERLLKTNNFPEFTGRVCPALCEAACTCGLDGEAVTSHENELAIIEHAFASGLMKPCIPISRSSRRIAVIGSGPSGLATADELNKRGHNVTVFEREQKPGGLLMYGIPNMKLDKAVIMRRIKLMEKEGVVFKTGVNIGIDISKEDLQKKYDAVVLCCGSKEARDLNADGRDAKGIYFAVDFLSDNTAFLMGEKKKIDYSTEGKNVIIVGGGDTGNDCVGTCIRQGCSSVIQLEMMPKLPEHRAANNPWPEWKRVVKTDYGQQEACAVFGHDPRIYQTTIKKINKDNKNKLISVITIDLEAKKDPDSGRMSMSEIPSTEKELPCELLLIAAGFTGCENYVAESFGLTRSARGTLQNSIDSFSTTEKGVFCAGDCRRGQSLVVHAIAEGRACAKQVDSWLMDCSN